MEDNELIVVILSSFAKEEGRKLFPPLHVWTVQRALVLGGRNVLLGNCPPNAQHSGPGDGMKGDVEQSQWTIEHWELVGQGNSPEQCCVAKRMETVLICLSYVSCLRDPSGSGGVVEIRSFHKRN